MMIAAVKHPPASITPTAPPMWFSMIVERWLRDMADNDVPDVLGQQLTVGVLLHDLLTLAGAPTPPAIAELVGAPA